MEKNTNTAEKVKRTKGMVKKFVRYKEGAELYSMGHCKVEQLSKETIIFDLEITKWRNKWFEIWFK